MAMGLAHSTRQCNTFWQDAVKNLGWRKVSELFHRGTFNPPMQHLPARYGKKPGPA